MNAKLFHPEGEMAEISYRKGVSVVFERSLRDRANSLLLNGHPTISFLCKEPFMNHFSTHSIVLAHATNYLKKLIDYSYWVNQKLLSSKKRGKKWFKKRFGQVNVDMHFFPIFTLNKMTNNTDHCQVSDNLSVRTVGVCWQCIHFGEMSSPTVRDDVFGNEGVMQSSSRFHPQLIITSFLKGKLGCLTKN